MSDLIDCIRARVIGSNRGGIMLGEGLLRFNNVILLI